MSLSLGDKLKIRAMAYLAGEPIPFFWPMRTFIHHNPLHGLEHQPFEDAVAEGASLFHGRAFLPRQVCQQLLVQGKVDQQELASCIDTFLAGRPAPAGIDLHQWLMSLLTEERRSVTRDRMVAHVADIRSQLQGAQLAEEAISPELVKAELRVALLGDCPVYEAIDNLYGTKIGADLDELLVKTCLDFFDEGQSVWHMPGRQKGLFMAWRDIARRQSRLSFPGLHIERILAEHDSPEGVIAHVMEALKVPEKQWVAYFTRELARLHGWSGFVRWRANAKRYYWNERYPADLVDLIAVRMTLALSLLTEQVSSRMPASAEAVEDAIENNTGETYLRHELYGRKVLPACASRVEQALARGRREEIAATFDWYVNCKRDRESRDQAKRLLSVASRVGAVDTLRDLPTEDLTQLVDALHAFEQRENMAWLRALEAQAMKHLLQGVNLTPPKPRDKRPFVQALFCIDTRSERIRRHLEHVGDYQTFGIAGFFGVPLSFMELGKGSETHLCPVLLTPRNLALEMTVSGTEDIHAVTAVEKALHALKESVLTPFVTVEAIGLLFGFDMIGKTVIPQSYSRWRQRLHKPKPPTHLLIDKLSREQADSIVRAVQRAVIEAAVAQEFSLEAERITDEMVRDLREAALGRQADTTEFRQALSIDIESEQHFIKRLREIYRIDPAFAQLQMERLARIGFSIDEQVGFVSQALSAIGLTQQFSRFVLLVGHGSTSDNNPYESALDCGACGGNHGLVNARALAHMANKPEVRSRLRNKGIHINDDAWFIPALHNTTTDEIRLYDLERIPSTHVVYIDRMRNGLLSASRLCAQERLPTLQHQAQRLEPVAAQQGVQRNAVDWSQVRPEWGLSRNAYFIVGRRDLTRDLALEGRSFLHSYDYRLDPKRRLLENILTGPLVVGQWINMEHFFSTVDNERYGSGSKAYHNVAGRFGVMSGNLSDLRTGLPAQTVLDNGHPYHEPVRLITVIEAPLNHAQRAVEDVVAVKQLVRNGWIRLLVIDPEQNTVFIYDDGEWERRSLPARPVEQDIKESAAS